MFDRIAPVYDVMNRVMTAGLDGRWRRLAVNEVVWPGDRVLDACCGTGDLAVEAERRGGRVVGLDFSEQMLARVLTSGGRLAVLEITRPRGILQPFFRVWFDVLVPFAGRVLPGGKAYTYLPASVQRFPGPEDLSALLRRAGFEQVRYRLLGGGSVALHTAVVL